MRPLRVAAAVLNQTPLAWEDNKRHILDALRAARHQRIHVLCLPELCVTGYGCEDEFRSPAVARTAQAVLEEILPHTQEMIVALGLPIAHDGALFNAACLAADGRLLGFVAKQHLASGGICAEPRWFRPWPRGLCVERDFAGRRYPLGDVTFRFNTAQGDLTIAVEIGGDSRLAGTRFEDDSTDDNAEGDNSSPVGANGSRANGVGANRARAAGDELSAAGWERRLGSRVDLILNPSASHFAFGRYRLRRRRVLDASRSCAAGYVHANAVGNETGRAIYEGGALIASEGRLLAAGRRFSFEDYGLTAAVVDLDAVGANDLPPEALPAATTSTTLIRVGFEPAPSAPDPPPATPAATPVATPPLADWEAGAHVQQEEFARAIALGLFDYLRKSRARGFAVSLSGGVDSAVVAILAALAVHFGGEELGLDRLLGKLSHISDLADARDVRGVLDRLLSCVYQATRNSSTVTWEAACAVTESIGVRCLRFDVQPMVEAYVATVSRAIARPLTWERDDTALQNVQARARGPGVWLLANVHGALLLATSNRSEALVGYATMDGDTCGGLAPIAGIDKPFLRRWLTWMERHGPNGFGPLPALAAVNRQAPTAELRPPSAEQTDEADLMPYDLLGELERLILVDRLTPTEALQRLESQPGPHDRAQLAAWIERFVRLWLGSQWKRERFAPSFHVDDDHPEFKVAQRWPILSGGGERELAELRAYAARSRADAL